MPEPIFKPSPDVLHLVRVLPSGGVVVNTVPLSATVDAEYASQIKLVAAFTSWSDFVWALTMPDDLVEPPPASDVPPVEF